MRVDWCVSSWFRIKNTHSLTLTTAGGTEAQPYEETLCNESRRPSHGEEGSLTSTPPHSPRAPEL